MVARGCGFKVSIVNLPPGLQSGTYSFLLSKCHDYNRPVPPCAPPPCFSGSLLIEIRLLKKWGLEPTVSLFKNKIGITARRHLGSIYSGPKETLGRGICSPKLSVPGLWGGRVGVKEQLSHSRGSGRVLSCYFRAGLGLHIQDFVSPWCLRRALNLWL